MFPSLGLQGAALEGKRCTLSSVWVSPGQLSSADMVAQFGLRGGGDVLPRTLAEPEHPQGRRNPMVLQFDVRISLLDP